MSPKGRKTEVFTFEICHRDSASNKKRYTKNMPRIILTTHARERIRDRKISMQQIQQTITHPNSVQRSSHSEQKRFQKRLGHQTVTVIAATNPKGEWVVLSCWLNPPNAGTQDAKSHAYWQQYKRASFLGKFWLVLKRQLGLA